MQVLNKEVNNTSVKRRGESYAVLLSATVSGRIILPTSW